MDLKQRLVDPAVVGEGEDEVLLGQNESGFLQRRKKRFWRYRKRKTRPCAVGLCCLVGIWSISALSFTVLCYLRLSHTLKSQSTFDSIYHGLYMPLSAVYNGERNSKDCGSTLNLINGQLAGVEDNVLSSNCYTGQHSFFKYHSFVNGSCLHVPMSRNNSICDVKTGFNLFKSKKECERICISAIMNYQKVAAPLGARLMLSGFVLSIFLVFTFICLPFDSDKIRLKRRLKKWLFADMLLIMVVAIITTTGSILVVKHDGRNDDIMSTESFMVYKVYWDVALLLSPMVVLAFHVNFWRRAYSIFEAIDTSKPAISGVWSTIM